MFSTRQANLVVIGTSNAVMTYGWVRLSEKQAQQLGYEIDNRSLGGASSRYATYMIDIAEKFKRKDRIVLDFAVNDIMLIRQSCISISDVLGHYSALFSTLAKRDDLDKILVLLFPVQTLASHSEPNTLFDALIDLFENLGVGYIDFRTELQKWSEETGRSIDDAYADDRHFNPEFQAQVGEIVLQQISGALPSAMSKHHPVRKALKALPDAGYVDMEVTSEKPLEKTEKSTSLTAHEVHSFHKGDQFNLVGANYLTAALIWCQPTSGAIVFTGSEQKLRLHLRRAYTNIFLFDTFTQPLAADPAIQADVRNDHKVPFQKVLGIPSSIYDDTGSTSEVVSFIGCAIPPTEYWEDHAEPALKLAASAPLPVRLRITQSIGRWFGPK